MSGPTLQDRLDHLSNGLAEVERRYASGEPYPNSEGSWPEKIAHLKRHIVEVQEMIANE